MLASDDTERLPWGSECLLSKNNVGMVIMKACCDEILKVCCLGNTLGMPV